MFPAWRPPPGLFLESPWFTLCSFLSGWGGVLDILSLSPLSEGLVHAILVCPSSAACTLSPPPRHTHPWVPRSPSCWLCQLPLSHLLLASGPALACSPPGHPSLFPLFLWLLASSYLNAILVGLEGRAEYFI